MKFPWSKPSAYEIVEALFNEFTPEERAILDGENCALPHMCSLLLEEAKISRSNYPLEEAKQMMKRRFFPLGNKINDPKIQKSIFFSSSLSFFIALDK